MFLHSFFIQSFILIKETRKVKVEKLSNNLYTMIYSSQKQLHVRAYSHTHTYIPRLLLVCPFVSLQGLVLNQTPVRSQMDLAPG